MCIRDSPITIAAALFQCLRTSLQKHLKGELSDVAATATRFFYAWPLAIVYLAFLMYYSKSSLPRLTVEFACFLILGSVSQILFTFLLIWMFSFRNFAVGNTYSKTETAQIAILGFVILGDTITSGAVLAITTSAIGVLMLSAGKAGITLSTLLSNLREKSTLIGLTSGFFLGLSVIFYRGASLSLVGGDEYLKAATTVAFSTSFQTLLLCIYLRVRDPGQIHRILCLWSKGG